MPTLNNLLQRAPASKAVRMSAAGFAAWVCWQDVPDPAVSQTMQDYGGMSIIADRDQSLWFFFSADILLALARLAVWAKFSNIQASVAAFPAKFVVGNKREIGLDTDAQLGNQSLLPSRNFEIWLHPKLRERGDGLPGLSFSEKTAVQGMAKIPWSDIRADPRLPYSSSQGWYAVIHPLGNPLDKLFQAGWRTVYDSLESLFTQHKLKSLPHEYFIIVQVDNLAQLRLLLREFFVLIDTAKNAREYWPCVSAVVDRKGLSFNSELSSKIGLKWENLTPDYPYMSYRNAYLLGEGFSIYDVRSPGEQISMDSWCNIGLGENTETRRTLPVTIPGLLTAGSEGGCFFCGQGSHPSAQCPTLQMPVVAGDPWRDLARLSFEDMNEAFRGLETSLTELGTAGYKRAPELDGKADILLRALFDINAVCQLRMVPRIWLAKGSDYPRRPDEAQHPADASPVWDLLDQLRAAGGDRTGKVEKEIRSALQRFPRDGRLHTLLGFCGVAEGNLSAALDSFREGAALTHSILIQAWNEYLQARVLEMQGRHIEACGRYDNVQRIVPTWEGASYRILVCKVKLGFGEQALEQLNALIASDPNYFNRCLIDPELERGRLLILSTLHLLWSEAEGAVEVEKAKLRELGERIDIWYPEGRPGAERLGASLRDLRVLAEVKNYVACLQVRSGRPLLEKDLAEAIRQDTEQLQERYKRYLTILQNVRDEASWFPFQNILVSFNKEFNECANVINWAFTSNFKEPEIYKKAAEHTAGIEESLRDLKKRLKVLRIVRDTTLFVLTMGKTFFWVEIISLFLCFILVPGIIYFGDRIGLGMLQETLAGQLWEIQKVLVLIVTVVAAGIAALRSTLVFDKRRDRLLEEARAQREKAQRQRLENIRQRRRLEAEAKLKAGAAEQKREQARELKARMEP
jgi:tetratricopeptide (TPR) repeat protein